MLRSIYTSDFSQEYQTYVATNDGAFWLCIGVIVMLVFVAAVLSILYATQ